MIINTFGDPKLSKYMYASSKWKQKRDGDIEFRGNAIFDHGYDGRFAAHIFWFYE